MAEERKQLEQELVAVKLANEQSVNELAETQAANKEKDHHLQSVNEDQDCVCKEKDHELSQGRHRRSGWSGKRRTTFRSCVQCRTTF